MSVTLPSALPKSFSLRAHAEPVACLCAWENRLVSADRLGEVIVWDLATRRASARWRAHEGHVLSMRPTALGLMTHGRDSTVRMWRVNLATAPNGSTAPSDQNNLECVFEMPVNALNFCNVAVAHDNGAVVFATPASVDSDGVDIYRLSPDLDLLRVAQNLVAPTEVSADGARGHGIVMRMEWAARTLYVGYESGALAAFATTAHGAEAVWLAPAHSPHPVLSLAVEITTGAKLDANRLSPDERDTRVEVWSGSAGKSVLQHEFVSGIAGPLAKHNLRHYGIQCLQVAGDMVVAGFWDGVVKGYGRDWHERFRVERAHEHIEAPAAPLRKSVCVLVWAPASAEDGSRRALLRLRRANTRLLFVGHADGLVTAYTV